MPEALLISFRTLIARLSFSLNASTFSANNCALEVSLVFNATFADGSGSFIKIDLDEIVEWVRPAQVLDGLARPVNDEIIFGKLERLK